MNYWGYYVYHPFTRQYILRYPVLNLVKQIITTIIANLMKLIEIICCVRKNMRSMISCTLGKENQGVNEYGTGKRVYPNGC